VLNASQYGVPQDRRRLFLIGARRGFPLPGYPSATHAPRQNGNGTHLFLKQTPQVWDSLRDLPEADDYEELLYRDWVRARFNRPTPYGAIMRGDQSDPADCSYDRVFDPGLLTSSLRTVHTDLSRKRFSETRHGETEPVSRFHKLDPEGICNTIRAGTASDHGAFTSPRPIHPYSPRCITVREAARLHSYPDWFRFHITKWHGFRQIGNSVPPLLARAVAGKIREAFGAVQKPIAAITQGDARLLSFDMSAAAAYYDVSPDIIPKRLRASRRDR